MCVHTGGAEVESAPLFGPLALRLQVPAGAGGGKPRGTWHAPPMVESHVPDARTEGPGGGGPRACV